MFTYYKSIHTNNTTVLHIHIISNIIFITA